MSVHWQSALTLIAEEPCQIEIADRDRYRDRKYGYNEHGMDT